MSARRDRWLALGLGMGVAVLSVLPYLAAERSVPAGWQFGGFLVNPLDGFSYLAKMRQGMEGEWSFVLPYAADPGPRACLFLFYLALGKLTGAMSLPPIFTFHGARLLTTVLMFACVYLLLENISMTRFARWVAYSLCLAMGGLSWLTAAVGVLGSDLMIPESMLWFSGLVNPHFPLAAAALACGMLAFVLRDPTWRTVALGLSAGLVLGLVQPFVLATLWSVGGAFLVLEALAAAHRRQPIRPAVFPGLVALAAMAAGGGPWVVYDLWVSTTHPVLSIWSRQNLTPSPGSAAYLAGFGVLLAWAVFGIIRDRPLRHASVRLMLVWAVVGLVLLYLPIGLQRRLSLGLAIPLAALAGMGIGALPAAPNWKRFAAGVTLAAGFPSILLVAASGVAGASLAGGPLVISEGELQAYTWMGEHLTEESLILSAMMTGNRIPAFSSARVVIGHPFETPNAAAEEQWVQHFFQDPCVDSDLLQAVRQRGVTHVFYGPEEARLGEFCWRDALVAAFANDEVVVYSVP
jgi:hypothetical protein